MSVIQLQSAMLLLCLVAAGSQLAGASSPEYYVTTDSYRYEHNDTVLITFTNPTTETVYFPGSPPWWISDPTGLERVYTPASIPDPVPVAPDESRNWSYDLRDEFGGKIGPGQYRANVHVLETEDSTHRNVVFAEFLACTHARPLPEGLIDTVVRALLCEDLSP